MPTEARRPVAFTTEERQEILDHYGRFISKGQAASILSCSERTIGRQVDGGLLTLYTIGRSRTLRLKTVEVLALMQRSSEMFSPCAHLQGEPCGWFRTSFGPEVPRRERAQGRPHAR